MFSYQYQPLASIFESLTGFPLRYHIIFGVGVPIASHVNVSEPPSFIITFSLGPFLTNGNSVKRTIYFDIAKNVITIMLYNPISKYNCCFMKNKLYLELEV